MSKQDRGKDRGGFTLIELLVVIAIIAILIGLLLPAVQKVREAGNRAKCQNNLKEIALACHSYHDTYEAFPCCRNDFVADPPYLGYCSEFIPLLPFLEQGNLYQQLYNMAVAKNAPMGTVGSSSGFFGQTPGSDIATPLAVLVCPSDQLPSPPTAYFPNDTPCYVGVTSYMGNVGATGGGLGTDGVFFMIWDYGTTGSLSLLGITDGTSNTILFGERSNYDPLWNTFASVYLPYLDKNTPFYALNSAWGTSITLNGPNGDGGIPLNYTISQQNPPVAPTDPFSFDTYSRGYAFGSGHTQGANFVFCDGSVHYIGNAINNASVITDASGNSVTLLQALCTRAGGEVVDASRY